MLASAPKALDLCRKEPGELNPGELMELRRQLQGLADWWLCPEVLTRMQQLVGRVPRQRVRPALPVASLRWSGLETAPTVAMHSARTRRVSPELRRMIAQPASRPTS